MLLSELIAKAGDTLTLAPNAAQNDPDITGLTADSRKVEDGFLFAAIPGTKIDGRAYIPAALDNGAKAILVLNDDATDTSDARARYLLSDNPRRSVAKLAAAFAGAQPDTIIGVTGTNGKSSIVNFLRQIWTRLGLRAASLGTVGLTTPDFHRPGGLTTPDPTMLHQDLKALTEAGVDHLAMETSSHGLSQHRPDGVHFKAAALTNLTRDHMDYHDTFDDYLRTKLRLFTELLPKGAPAVLNPRCAGFDTLKTECEAAGLTVITYGWEENSDVHVAATPGDGYQDLVFTVFGRRYETRLPLVGNFQAENACCALALATATGADAAAVVDAIGHLEGVPGRLELIAETPNGAKVYVDYAHTPDAHLYLLPTLRGLTTGKLTLVFGCGGDRDPGKRPMMGEIATRLTDHIYVTDDNPRSEDPAKIRAEILAVCPAGIEIGDRSQAIKTAVRSLEPGDVMVVTGKGPDQGQIYGDVKLPFDDREEIRKAVKELSS